MNRVTLLVLCVTLLTACKGNDSDTALDCTYWCPDFDGDGRGEFSTECAAYCYVDGLYPPDNGCRGTPYVANCDEVRPPFAE
jgi:hypothetical protein